MWESSLKLQGCGSFMGQSMCREQAVENSLSLSLYVCVCMYVRTHVHTRQGTWQVSER